MAVTSKTVQVSVTLTGASQSEDSASIMGWIDQIIVESSTSGQFIKMTLKNDQSQVIWGPEEFEVNTVKHDIRPRLLPRGIVTVLIEDPVNASGTITATFIEQERGG